MDSLVQPAPHRVTISKIIIAIESVLLVLLIPYILFINSHTPSKGISPLKPSPSVSPPSQFAKTLSSRTLSASQLIVFGPIQKISGNTIIITRNSEQFSLDTDSSVKFKDQSAASTNSIPFKPSLVHVNDLILATYTFDRNLQVKLDQIILVPRSSIITK